MQLAKAVPPLGVILAAAVVLGVGAFAFNDARSAADLAPRRVGVLTITFDDAFRNQYVHALPVLQQYELRGTTFLTTAFIGDVAGTSLMAAMTWAEAAEWRDAGWEIGAHTETHRDLPPLAAVEIKAELAYPAIRIYQELGVVPTSFSSPHGYIDDRVRAMVMDTFDAHVRTRPIAEQVSAGLNHMPPLDPYDISRFEMSRGMAPSLACDKIELAVEQGSWLVLSFHGILPEPSSSDEERYFYSVADLAAIAQCTRTYIDAGTLESATIAEVLTRQAGV
ncbi:MAG: polysaccharide deacetylase family protein [Bauldia sp.]